MGMAASPYEAVDANGRRARSESEMETTASSYEADEASKVYSGDRPPRPQHDDGKGGENGRDGKQVTVQN